MKFKTAEERNTFIENHMKLAYFVLNRYFYDFNDDMEQEAMIQLIKCVDSFEDLGKVKFSTYAIGCIYKKLLSYINKDSLIKPIYKKVDGKYVYDRPFICSLSDIIEGTESVDLYDALCDLDEDVEAKVIAKDLSIKLNEYLDSIDETKRKCLLLRLGGESYVNIGKTMHISKQRAHQMITPMIKKLNEIVNNYER